MAFRFSPSCNCCAPPCVAIEDATYSNDFTSNPFAAASPYTWTKCLVSGTQMLQWDGSTAIDSDKSADGGTFAAQVPIRIDPGITSFYIESNVEVESSVCNIGIGIEPGRLFAFRPNPSFPANYQINGAHTASVPFSLCNTTPGGATASAGTGLARLLRITFTRNGSNWDVEYKADGSVVSGLTETNVTIADLTTAIAGSDCLMMGIWAIGGTFFSVRKNLWAYDFAYSSS